MLLMLIKIIQLDASSYKSQDAILVCEFNQLIFLAGLLLRSQLELCHFLSSWVWVRVSSITFKSCPSTCFPSSRIHAIPKARVCLRGVKDYGGLNEWENSNAHCIVLWIRGI